MSFSVLRRNLFGGNAISHHIICALCLKQTPLAVKSFLSFLSYKYCMDDVLMWDMKTEKLPLCRNKFINFMREIILIYCINNNNNTEKAKWWKKRELNCCHQQHIKDVFIVKLKCMQLSELNFDFIKKTNCLLQTLILTMRIHAVQPFACFCSATWFNSFTYRTM